MLGIMKSEGDFAVKPVLCSDKNNGSFPYCFVHWKKDEKGFEIKREVVSGSFSGLQMEELDERCPELYWANEPIKLFSGAYGFYMKNDLAAKLNDLSTGDAFSGIKVCDELHGSDVILGFSVMELILQKTIEWYKNLEVPCDKLLRKYLIDSKEMGEEAKKVVRELKSIAFDQNQREMAILRYLLVTQDQNYSDSRLESWCREIHGNDYIGKTDKVFSNPENVRKALDTLRKNLTE